MRIEAFVADTQALLWFAGNARRKLGKGALRAFDAYQAGEAVLYVPAPVVLETWFLARRGTIRLEGTLSQWWRRVSSSRLIFEAMTAEDIMAAADLNWAHRDVYDRLIVATAQRLGFPLVTKDAAIADWSGVRVLW